MGHLKYKSLLIVLIGMQIWSTKYGKRKFWCTWYYVDTVGCNKKVIQEYIKSVQEEYCIWANEFERILKFYNKNILI